METRFSLAQLADPDTAESERILRSCVHCGFCASACPTYALLGDERDSPRGRIYLIKNMLEGGRPADEPAVRHVDRCLSCLSCMTTCPSGVDYMHLVDHARAYIERTFRRPWIDRTVRKTLAAALPRPRLFRILLGLVPVGRLAAALLPERLRAILSLAPAGPVRASFHRSRAVHPARGPRRRRVALLPGCVQQVLAPEIDRATIRLLTRHGCEVVVAGGCCGAIAHHLGKDARAAARRNVRAWMQEDIDAVVVNASGCGTMVKDYGHLLKSDPELSAAADRIGGIARDVSEVMDELGLPVERREALRVAYHGACSLQHGQRIVRQPRELLASAGFAVVEPAEAHLCCGSAGTYNLLQPEIAIRLRDRKASSIEAVRPDVVATGNIGCMVQLRNALAVPIVHTVELLDWTTGGPMPDRMKNVQQERNA